MLLSGIFDGLDVSVPPALSTDKRHLGQGSPGFSHGEDSISPFFERSRGEAKWEVFMPKLQDRATVISDQRIQ